MDPYEVLGVSRNADQDAIKKAYKKLARKYHPDVNKDPGAEDIFKQINSAYDVLGDAQKRKNWDEFGEVSTRPGFDADQARQFRGFGGGGGGGRGGFAGESPFGRGFYTQGGHVDLDDMLGSIFGAGFDGSARRGVDVRSQMTIPFLLAVHGGEETLVIPRPDGTREPLKVRIPPGVKTGGTLRLKGQGLPPRGGGPCGDLHLNITVQDHPVLRRNGDDLEMDVPITVREAMEGGKLTVPTPTGDVKVTVPRDVGSGKRLRIKGRGIQKRPPGDLYLVLRPTVPQTDSDVMLQAARMLDEAYTTDIRADLKI